MSLLWLDRLNLFVHPQRVVVERKSWRRPVDRHSYTVPPATEQEAAWQPVLAIAAQHLPSLNGARLNIVIANPFVRYALLPWSEAVLGDKARLGLARALLKSSLGTQVADYEVALDRASFGCNGLAAAIHRGLLDGLRQVAKAKRLHLGELQPQLTKELAITPPLNDGCLAFAGNGWLTLLGKHKDNYCLLRNHRTDDEPTRVQNELLNLLSIEGADIDSKKLRLVSENTWPDKLGEWSIERQPSRFIEVSHAA